MTLLVTLDQAKAHLRVDHDVEDEDIEFKIHQASEVVLGYLKDAALDFVDTSGTVILDTDGGDAIPYRVKAATLCMLAILWGNRGEDGGQSSKFEMGFVPPIVTALLYPLRTPTVV